MKDPHPELASLRVGGSTDTEARDNGGRYELQDSGSLTPEEGKPWLPLQQLLNLDH